MLRFRSLSTLCFALVCTVSAAHVAADSYVSNQANGSVNSSSKPSKFPFPEKLNYRVEWRLITAGAATLELTHATPENWLSTLTIESAGVIARLYKVLDKYKVSSDAKFCLSSAELEAQENKRHMITHTEVAKDQHTLRYEEKDLVKNTTAQKDLEVSPCTREVTGALASLRLTNLEPGKSITLPITDGKKVVNARIESQAREVLNFDGKKYETVRYEAFLFDNVLYRRKGRLFIWITEDEERLPVQFRIQLGFPIGNVMIQLEKQQRIAG